MILTLILLTSTVGILYFWYKRRNMERLAAKIPSVEGSAPIIGITHRLVGDNEAAMRTLQDFSYSSMKHDGIVKGWLGHLLYFVVVDPVDMEHVLKTCLEKDDFYRHSRQCFGYGSLMAPDTTLGVKINTQNDPDSPFLNAVSTTVELICQRVFSLWLQPDWLYSFFPQYKTLQKCIVLLHDFTDNVISKKREELKTEKFSKTKVDHKFDLEYLKNASLLDHLIKLPGEEKGFTDLEIREETLIMAIAGTDTSAVALGFTIQLLAKYPEVQEKLYQEIYDVFGDSDRSLVNEDLMKLKYLERVIKESLRLLPPVPFIGRKVLEDTKLPSGRVLPAGSGTLCSIWGIHRDPKYWGPNAEEFDPDRFLPGRLNLKHECSFMPFSNGPRNCIGYQYALMSMKTVLSTVLREYKIVEDRENGPVPKFRVNIDIMMKAVEGYRVALEKRKRVP